MTRPPATVRANGAAITAARKAQNLTQEDVAARTGFTQPFICKAEASRIVRRSSIIAIALALGLGADGYPQFIAAPDTAAPAALAAGL